MQKGVVVDLLDEKIRMRSRCCARAASGHAAAAPPMSVMNSRRLMLIFPGLLSVLAALSP
jgi:uncharacterized protein YchJ